MTTRLKRTPKSVPVARPFTMGPWIGMRDSADVNAHDPRFAKLLLNVYPEAPHEGSSLRERPGLILSDSTTFTNGHANVFHQLTKLDGTEYSYAVVGGKLYRYNWTDAVWTEWVVEAQFTTATISRSQWARWYAVTFNDKAVFSDGVNVPWMHDGTERGGLTKLSNAPVFYGPPVVHYGKLLGIDASERSTFMWSEENQPNTGYEAGGYSNAWTLLQTDTNKLVRILPDNEVAYVFRERSITVVFGEVNENFRSTGSREGVSEEIGTTAPASVFWGGLNGDLIFFTDADGRPYFMPRGGKPIPIWEDARQTLATFDRSRFPEIEGYWDSNTQHAVFCYGKPGEVANGTSGLGFKSHELRYHMYLGRPQLCSVTDGQDIIRVGLLKAPDRSMRVFQGKSHGISSPAAWYLYERALPTSHVVDDGAVSYATEDSQTSENAAIFIGGTSSQAAGFTFTTSATLGKVLRSVTLRMKYDTAALSGTLYIRLRRFTGTYTNPTLGAIIAEETFALSQLTSSYVTYETIFSHPCKLFASRQYLVTIEPESLIATGFLVLRTQTPDAHGGVTITKSASGWAVSAEGLYFSVKGQYGTVEHKVVTHPEPEPSEIERYFDRADVYTSPLRDLLGLNVAHVGPHGRSARQETDIIAGLVTWDGDDEWDSAVPDPDAQPRKTSLGIEAYGTGIGLVLWQLGGGLQFPLLKAAISGRPTSNDAGVR